MGPVRSAEEVAYSLRRYLSIKSAYSPDFSPDDKRIAYLSDLTGVPQIWMTTVSGVLLSGWTAAGASDFRFICSRERAIL
jgi:Tol biopolymer transport system component